MKLAINGFGRIGRQALRIIRERYADQIDVVLINDLTDAATLAHLFEFDSTYGRNHELIVVAGDGFTVGNDKIRLTAEKDPSKLPHKELGVDVVLECTGRFIDKAGASLHLQAGAKKVLISAPAKDQVDATLCMGVNHETYDPKTMHVISNASCTTNCLAPMAKVLNDVFGIEHGLMTTIHSYTNDQNLLDLPHKDLRRARAAAVNMVPSTTGAAKAIGLVIPELAGKLHGSAIRVPTPTGSITDLTVVTKKPVTKEAVNQAFRDAANGPLKNVLRVEDKPIVLKDIVGDPHSSIIDSDLTQVIGTNLLKTFSWYDNEWGYSNRLVEMALYVSKGM
jgi:glyceraldehyde 3-phosphate dehydrogenase